MLLFIYGLWPVFALIIIGILVFGYQTVKASKSNSTTQTNGGLGPVEDNTGNVPFYQVAQFKYVVILLAALIVVGISVYVSYH